MGLSHKKQPPTQGDRFRYLAWRGRLFCKPLLLRLALGPQVCGFICLWIRARLPNRQNVGSNAKDAGENNIILSQKLSLTIGPWKTNESGGTYYFYCKEPALAAFFPVALANTGGEMSFGSSRRARTCEGRALLTWPALSWGKQGWMHLSFSSPFPPAKAGPPIQSLTQQAFPVQPPLSNARSANSLPSPGALKGLGHLNGCNGASKNGTL